jgi:hypothetical protein
MLRGMLDRLPYSIPEELPLSPLLPFPHRRELHGPGIRLEAELSRHAPVARLLQPGRRTQSCQVIAQATARLGKDGHRLFQPEAVERHVAAARDVDELGT